MRMHRSVTAGTRTAEATLPSRVAAVLTGVLLLVALNGVARSAEPAVATLHATGAPAETSYTGAPGKYRVESFTDDWHDDARDRDVPVKVYLPADATGPLPVIVVSHGLGGSREGIAYAGQHWASHGYVSVHLQHKGSDTDVWRGKLNPMQAAREAAGTAANALNRPLDVRCALDHLARLNKEKSRLTGRLDMQRVGVAGHSFGAYTALAVAGEVFTTPLGRTISARDPRVKAAVVMSAPVPKRADYDKAFGQIPIPCLHMTGTLDDSPIGETAKEDRRVPFDHAKAADSYLVTFEGGDHMIFSGRDVRLRSRPQDAAFHKLICASSTAFFDAYLRGNDRAKDWLADGGFARLLDKKGKFEVKQARSK